MEWVCTDCERTYHEPPDACRVCGNESLVPEDEHGSGRPGLATLFSNVRGTLTDPGSIDRSLVRHESTVDLLFRVLLVGSLVLIALFLLAAVMR